MQQHTMMRNQSTGDGPEWVDREALRRKHGGKVLPGSRGIPEPAAAVEGAAADRALLAHDQDAIGARPEQHRTRARLQRADACRGQDRESLRGYTRHMVEPGGIEPPTSCMPCRRSPS